MKVDALEVKECTYSIVKNSYENKTISDNVTPANGDEKEKLTHKNNEFESVHKFQKYEVEAFNTNKRSVDKPTSVNIAMSRKSRKFKFSQPSKRFCNCFSND